MTDYEITAIATLESGTQIEGKIVIETTDALKIYYRWQQTILGFEERGSSCWPPVDADSADQIDIACSPATLFHTVYDLDPAVPDGAPVAGTTVEVLGGEPATSTNDEGFFRLSGIEAGLNAQPLELTLRASNGEHAEEHRVTVACNGFVEVDFGRPPGTRQRLHLWHRHRVEFWCTDGRRRQHQPVRCHHHPGGGAAPHSSAPRKRATQATR